MIITPKKIYIEIKYIFFTIIFCVYFVMMSATSTCYWVFYADRFLNLNLKKKFDYLKATASTSITKI